MRGHVSSTVRVRLAATQAELSDLGVQVLAKRAGMAAEELFDVTGCVQGVAERTRRRHKTRLTERGPVELHPGLRFVDRTTPSEVSLATGLGNPCLASSGPAWAANSCPPEVNLTGVASVVQVLRSAPTRLPLSAVAVRPHRRGIPEGLKESRRAHWLREARFPARPNRSYSPVSHDT